MKASTYPPRRGVPTQLAMRAAELLTTEEVGALLEASLEVFGPQDEEALGKLVAWAQRAMLDHITIQMCLAGKVGICWKDGEMWIDLRKVA